MEAKSKRSHNVDWSSVTIKKEEPQDGEDIIYVIEVNSQPESVSPVSDGEAADSECSDPLAVSQSQERGAEVHMNNYGNTSTQFKSDNSYHWVGFKDEVEDQIEIKEEEDKCEVKEEIEGIVEVDVSNFLAGSSSGDYDGEAAASTDSDPLAISQSQEGHGLFIANRSPTRGENCLDTIATSLNLSAYKVEVGDPVIADHCPLIMDVSSETDIGAKVDVEVTNYVPGLFTDMYFGEAVSKSPETPVEVCRKRFGGGQNMNHRVKRRRRNDLREESQNSLIDYQNNEGNTYTLFQSDDSLSSEEITNDVVDNDLTNKKEHRYEFNQDDQKNEGNTYTLFRSDDSLSSEEITNDVVDNDLTNKKEHRYEFNQKLETGDITINKDYSSPGMFLKDVYSCETCKKSFGSKADLQEHQTIVHPGFKPFGHKKYLMQYLTCVRGGLRLYTCGTCYRVFKKRKALIQHEIAKHLRQINMV